MTAKLRRNRTRPGIEGCETRVLLSGSPNLFALLRLQPAFALVRPNTPVAPFGSVSSGASFIDPSATILHGQHAAIGLQSLIGPYATIDARHGFIKIGSGSAVLDNATVRSTEHAAVLIGDNVTVEFGATILGPSAIGSFGGINIPGVEIGPNATIDGATIEPGAIVSGLARVGPGVVLPSFMRVLPGKNVTTEAEATNPALGKVVPVTPAESAKLAALLVNDQSLAAGFANLYQGNAATGQNPGIRPSVSGVYSGDLSTVEGTSLEPGVKIEPGRFGPRFAIHKRGLAQGLFPAFPVRSTGTAYFQAKPLAVARQSSFHDSIRADQGQPITFVGPPTLGSNVSINAPLSATGEGGSTTSPGAGSSTGASGTIGSGASAGIGTLVGSGSSGSNPGTALGNQIFPEPSQSFSFPDQSYSNPGANGVSLSDTLRRIDAASNSSGFGPTTTPPPSISSTNLLIGRNFKAGFGAVVLGGQSSAAATPGSKLSFIIGDNVTIGDGAVVERSSIGHDSVIGARSLISNTLLPPGTVIPPDTVVVRNKTVGKLEW